MEKDKKRYKRGEWERPWSRSMQILDQPKFNWSRCCLLQQEVSWGETFQIFKSSSYRGRSWNSGRWSSKRTQWQEQIVIFPYPSSLPGKSYPFFKAQFKSHSLGYPFFVFSKLKMVSRLWICTDFWTLSEFERTRFVLFGLSWFM